MRHCEPLDRTGWVPADRELAASPLQQAMVASTLAQPQTGLDVIQVVIRSHEGLRPSQVRGAFQHLVDTHPALRSSFRWESLAQPVIVTHPTATLPFGTAKVSPDRLGEWLLHESKLPFDLGCPPLCRATLLDLGEGEQAIVWTAHHAILDGGSVSILMDRWQTVMDGLGLSASCEDQDGPSVAAQRLQGLDRGRAQAFWSTALAGLTAPTRPTLWRSLPSTERLEATGACLAVSTRALTRLAKTAGASLTNIAQAAWGLTLATYSGESTVSFGATHAGRAGSAHLEAPVGMFIDTVPLVIKTTPTETVTDLVRQVRSNFRASREFLYASQTEIRTWCGWPQGVPLFESVMVFDPYSLGDLLRAKSPRWAGRSVSMLDRSTVPVTLMVSGQSELRLRLSYDPGVLAPDLAHAMLATTVHLLEEFARKPAGLLSDLTFLPPREEPAPHDDAPPQSVLERFCRHAIEAPERTAVEYRGARYSYRQLLDDSQRLAGALSQKVALEPGDVVAVVLDRGPGLAAALWALQWLDVAYAPVEPSMSATQLPAIVGHKRTRCVLTSRAMAATIPPQSCPILKLEDLTDEETTLSPDLDGLAPPRPASPALPAYVLYTSGSTGKPKGVEISQQSLARYVQRCGQLYRVGPQTRWLQLASLSFDISIEELFVTWGFGGTVVFKPEEKLQSVEQLEHWLTELDIHGVSPPTALWHEWASRATPDTRVPPSLNIVVVGGEAGATSALSRWRASAFHRVRLLNAYGPTEATVSVTYFEPALEPQSSMAWTMQHMPIGRPLEGVRARVVTADGQEAPDCAPGELWLAGEQLALGYADAPEQTAAVFTDHPTWGRCYRTGDIVCRLPEGQLAFLHRRDRQVKVRGFRLELGGLEAILQRHPAVSQALFAHVRDGGRARLLAWVVLNRKVESRELVSHLRASVPTYALPEAILEVGALPVNPAGKVDYERLPRPQATEVAPSGTARDSIYQTLHQIWAQRFPGQPLTPDVRLFDDLGADSLSALRMLAEIQARFGCTLPVGVLARADTLASLTEEIRRQRGRETVLKHIVPLKEQGSLPPFFLLHGGDGHALAFRELVPLLHAERPCYALDAGAFDTRTRRDVKSIASEYAAEIQRLLPVGPVHLAGFCLGGLIALNLAELLREAGYTVPVVGLINTYVPGWPKPRALPVRLALALRRGTLREQARDTLLFRLGLKPRPIDPPLAQMLNHAADQYRPRTIPGCVHLFRGTGDPRLYEPEDLGWTKYCRGRLVVHPRVPAFHTLMLSGPHAATVARQLETVLLASGHDTEDADA